MTNPYLIPFDLEKAKAGKAVIYRNSEVPEDVFYCNNGWIITIKNNRITTHCNTGEVYVNNVESPYDLFMAEEEMYANIYNNQEKPISLYYSLETAKEYARNIHSCKGTYKLVKIQEDGKRKI